MTHFAIRIEVDTFGTKIPLLVKGVSSINEHGLPIVDFNAVYTVYPAKEVLNDLTPTEIEMIQIQLERHLFPQFYSEGA